MNTSFQQSDFGLATSSDISESILSEELLSDACGVAILAYYFICMWAFACLRPHDNLDNATVDDLRTWMKAIRYEIIAHHVFCSFCALLFANFIMLPGNLLLDAFHLLLWKRVRVGGAREICDYISSKWLVYLMCSVLCGFYVYIIISWHMYKRSLNA